jgi:ATP/maltotriose-dependent transcriptional regulator MalT
LKLSGTPWLLSEVLYRSALAAIQSGAAASALEQSGQALELAREHGRPKQQGLCLLTRGAALAQLNRPAEAAGDFTGALALFQAPGHPSTLRADALAGLAEIALAEGDLDQARTYLAELDPLLRSDPLYQALEPMQILLTHCRLRLALAVPGAEEALAAALARLEACAALIAEPRQRQTYLERHSAHRELRKLADQFNLKP